MTSPLARLAALLAELFPDQVSSVRVMEAAKIHTERIYVEQAARSRWFAIVDEAEKDGKLPVLMEVASMEYPGRADLRKLREEMTRAQRLANPRLSALAIWPRMAGANPEEALEEDSSLYAAGIDYTALKGADATQFNVAVEWRRIQPTIVEVMAHGKRTEIYLTDGPTSVGWWGRLVADHPPELILLMSCESAQYGVIDLPEAMIREGVMSVVAASDQLLVKDAYRFLRIFYADYATHRIVTQAFEQGKLGMTEAGAKMIKLYQHRDMTADRQARGILNRSEPD